MLDLLLELFLNNMANPPVDFQPLAMGGGNPSGGGYPYQIKARDLMKNFVFATMDVEDNLVEPLPGLSGHTKRRLRIRAGSQLGQLLFWDGENYTPLDPPSGQGVFVLGCQGNTIRWIETEECA